MSVNWAVDRVNRSVWYQGLATLPGKSLSFRKCKFYWVCVKNVSWKSTGNHTCWSVRHPEIQTDTNFVGFLFACGASSAWSSLPDVFKDTVLSLTSFQKQLTTLLRTRCPRQRLFGDSMLQRFLLFTLIITVRTYRSMAWQNFGSKLCRWDVGPVKHV